MKVKKLAHRVFNIVAWLCIIFVTLVGLIFLYSRYVAPYDFSVVNTNIENPLIAESANGIKIMQFSDTHLGAYYSLKEFEKVVNAINKAKPDIVIFSGDLIDSLHDYKESTDDLTTLLSSINAPYGKFCVFGNHDYGGGAERVYPKLMKASGFTLLKNENYVIESLKLNFIGIDDVLIGYGDVKAAGKAIPGYYNIVIAHEPDIADDVAKYPVNLMLSSHTHGRQINISLLDNFILPPYGKRYIEGLYVFANAEKMRLYVTRGIGTTQIPIRFNSKPELSEFTLLKSLN